MRIHGMLRAGLLVLALPGALGAQVTAPMPYARVNDNRVAAGELREGSLTLNLVVREAEWRPEDDEAGPGFVVWAAGETAETPRIPAPMLRVNAGTEILVTVTNTLSDSLAFHGFHDHPATEDAPVLLLGGGETHTARFRVTTPGTFLYWAAAPGMPFLFREFVDGQLVGALIVDDPAVPAPPDERVFVITESFTFDEDDEIHSALVINGKGWPHTERLTYTQGETVHWRWINGTVLAHPMHLHGFYYRIHRRGEWTRTHDIASSEQRLVVTQLLDPGESMDMSFVPTTVGNWVFHCHLGLHVSGLSSLDEDMRASVKAGHGGGVGDRHMAGLVIGMHVKPAANATADRPEPSRTLRLLMQARDTFYEHGEGAYGFVVHEDGPEPAADSVQVPGPVLELRKDERIRITLINRLPEPTGVHWHGLEIESYPDGIPHWSGTEGHILPPVMPGDSLDIEFAPPRAGTFMYHSHLGESMQINRGLYGALIVRDPAAPAVREQILVIGAGGTQPQPLRFFESQYALVNGQRFVDPIELGVGETIRLRLISIHQDWRVRVTLSGDEGFLHWTPVAKDGAILPANLVIPRPAHWLAGPGETADFDFTATEPGTYRLEIRSADPGWHIPVEVIVRGR